MIDELSKRDAEALGVGDMTGPQLRWRVFQVEGMMCELALALEEMLEVFAPDDRWLNRRAIESAERAREVATSVRERYAHLPRKADECLKDAYVWQCEPCDKREYSEAEVLQMMREQNPGWFEREAVG